MTKHSPQNPGGSPEFNSEDAIKLMKPGQYWRCRSDSVDYHEFFIVSVEFHGANMRFADCVDMKVLIEGHIEDYRVSTWELGWCYTLLSEGP